MSVTTTTGPRPPGGARLRHVLGDPRVRIWVRLAPALVLVGGLSLAALWTIVTRSLGPAAVAGSQEGEAPGAELLASGPSLAAYRSLVTDPEFWPSVALTLHVAVTSTVVSVVLGVGFALLLRRVGVGRRTLTTLAQVNLPIPHVIGAVAMLLLLSQSGFVSRIATVVGVIDGPAGMPALLYDPYAIGVILQYVWKEVPFVAIVALAILHGAGEDLEQAAATLGASRWQRFRFVTLPVLLPGVSSTAIIVFAFAFGTFEVPLLLGASYPAVLPVMAHRRYTDVDLASRPEALALALLITLFVAVVVLVGAGLARRAVRRAGT